MLISIVTPAYNAERFLCATIDGVLAQTHQRFEYILVDDGSRDGTAALAEEYAGKDSRIRVLRQANAGVALARNAGLRLIAPDAEAVIFLDADDVWRPNCLELLRRRLQTDAGVPAVHGQAAGIDGEGRAIPLSGYEREGRRFLRRRGGFELGTAEVAVQGEAEPTSFSALALFNPISTPGQVLIRRSALDRVGSFDSQAKPAEDWDLWLRLAVLAPFGYLPQPVIDYRRHGDNASAQLSKMRRADLYVRQKTLHVTTRSQPEANRIARASLRHVELQRCATRLRLAGDDLRHLRVLAALKEVGRGTHSLWACVESFR